LAEARSHWLKKKHKLATQVGTQRHANPNFNRVRELIMDGAIGDLSAVYAWGNRQIPRPGYLPAAGDPPDYLNYDLWLGPSPWHPYNPGYFGGCLSWNMYWDFGSGQIGDMGSHMIDMAYWGLDLKLPTTCSAEGTEQNPDTCPQWLTAEWDHPANDWRPAIKLYWYDGGKKPGMPSDAFDREKLFFQPGAKTPAVSPIEGGKIGMMVCFDWFYPEVARVLAIDGAQVICHPSNLVLPWCQDAMRTRSIENRVFSITSNRIGTEKRGNIALTFTGKSQIVDPSGEVIVSASERSESLKIADVDLDEALNKSVTPNNDLFKDRKVAFYKPIIRKVV